MSSSATFIGGSPAKTRTIMLNSRALAALGRAREIASARKRNGRRVSAESPFIFQPAGRSPHMKGSSMPGFINQAVEATSIRASPQYNCRHTYATMCLMSGMNPAFIAGQLGHSVQVLLTTYAKWLNSANDWSELAKLEAAVIGTELVQD
nr:site-specific integrase [Pseudomonas mosselii]